ncbi:MAG: hypothetical protein DME38_01005 [Verrucomicrobia bacterium]|nr:MAG: hypothetical protein DME38_01005 [Verrucomicrobiota bacterium]
MSGANFDLASLSFQVPICGLAAKQAAAAITDSATITTAILVLIILRFRQKRPKTSISFRGFYALLVGA